MRSFRFKAAALFVCVLMQALSPLAGAMPAINTQAASMALIECESGTLLASQNKDMPLPMASTTKIMTALIVLENCDTEELVSIPDEAVGTEGSSIYLKQGESMKVIDLLYGLMLASGNDAAVALAVHAGGSVKDFVGMMNEKARAMGLEKTHFVTPNGLHADRHLTTAYELCLIAREALKNETFKQIVSTKYYEAGSGSVPRTFKNKNSLLWTYEGAFGVKTGYTMAAGRCLVFGAERDGMSVVGVVLNCRPMFETAAELMDAAFDAYQKETIIPEGAHAANIYIKNSIETVLEVETKSSIIAVMQRSQRRSFETRMRFRDEIEAPVKKGDPVGVLEVYENEELIGSCELIASHDVHERDVAYWWKLLASVFAA